MHIAPLNQAEPRTTSAALTVKRICRLSLSLSLCLSSTVTQRGSRDVAAVVDLANDEGSGMEESYFNATGESTTGPLRSNTPVTH